MGSYSVTEIVILSCDKLTTVVILSREFCHRPYMIE